jgi:hypothetical protein
VGTASSRSPATPDRDSTLAPRPAAPGTHRAVGTDGGRLLTSNGLIVGISYAPSLYEEGAWAEATPARHFGARRQQCPIGCVVVGHYESFFTASAGASAAILGLLVVAVTLVNADDDNAATRELRTVLAGSAFLALVDIFIVSIVALTGGSAVFGLASLAMAAVGLLATRRLIPRAKRAGNFSRSSRTRTLNIAFAAISIVAYPAQLGLAVALLANRNSAALQAALVAVIVALYCSALGRAWVVSGISRRA